MFSYNYTIPWLLSFTTTQYAKYFMENELNTINVCVREKEE